MRHERKIIRVKINFGGLQHEELRVTDQQSLAKINIARTYLNSTDYQRLREPDGGEPMSSEVKSKRIECRSVINECQEEIEALRAEWEEASSH